MAVDPALHRQFTAAQAENQLTEPAYVGDQSAMENIAENSEIREPILRRWLRENRGMSPSAAHRRAKRIMEWWRRDATEFAQDLSRLQSEAEQMRARRQGGC